MNTYVKIDYPNIFVETKEKPENLGLTYEDYLEGRPIKLTEDQALYHKDFPTAEVKDVLNVADYKDGKVTWHIVKLPMTVDLARELKINEINEYSDSQEINDMKITTSKHGEVHVWMTKEERTECKNTIDASKLLGVQDMTLCIGDYLFSLTVEEAERCLAMIQLYADRCNVVAKSHARAVMELETISEVQAYDFTTGYPPKVELELEEA